MALIYMERCITTTEITTLPICSTLKVPSCPFAVPRGGDCTPALGPDGRRCLLPIPTVLPFLESHRVMLVQTPSHFPSSGPAPCRSPLAARALPLKTCSNTFRSTRFGLVFFSFLPLFSSSSVSGLSQEAGRRFSAAL